MRRRFGPWEMWGVWGLYIAVAVEIVVTYSRTPLHELYHVSEGGFGGGAGRALVFLNYSTALVAIALAVLAADGRGGRAAAAVAAVAIALCAWVFVPGVVDQSDLDAKPVNAVAAAGVAVALALGLAAAGPRTTRGRLPGDRLRIAIAAVLFLAAIPWLAADLGFSLDHTPLGSVYQTGELRRQPGVPGLHPAVHLGHHHGMDGTLLAWSALVLSRVAVGVRAARVRTALLLYLSLMLVYGVANAAQDFWLEQAVKRGWTETEIPSVLQPDLDLAWGVIVLATAAVYCVAFRPGGLALRGR
jgi:hypothetical protein